MDAGKQMRSPTHLMTLLVVFGLISQWSCTGDSKSPQSPPKTQKPFVQVVDSESRIVKLSTQPKRVLSLAPVASEFVAQLGALDLLVGRTDHCNYPAEVRSVTSVGTLFPPNYEKIQTVQPDLVLMTSGQIDIRKRLEDLGAKVFVVQPPSIDAVHDMYLQLGKLLGYETVAREKALMFSGRLNTILKRVSSAQPRVFWEIWANPLQAAGPKGFMGDLLSRAGGINVIKDTNNPWPKVTPESIVSTNPDVIIASSQSSRDALLTKKRPGWNQTTAVKKRHVYHPPNMDAISRPGPRILEGFAWLIDVIGRHSSETNEP